jgi:hypothetical protein
LAATELAENVAPLNQVSPPEPPLPLLYPAAPPAPTEYVTEAPGVKAKLVIFE